MLSLSQRVATPAPRVVPAFWATTIPNGGWSYDFCIECRDEIVAALRKAVNSGTAEYHIGSRGLKRFTLKELQDLLIFWTNAANDAALGGFSSAIQSRRAAPCDV